MNENVGMGGKKEEKISFYEKVVLLIICLASMNFGGKYFYLIFFAFFITLFLNRGRLLVNNATIALTLLSISLLIQDVMAQDGFNEVIKNLAFPLSYMLGYYLGLDYERKGQNRKQDEKWLQILIFSVAFGSLIHVVLNMMLNLRYEIGATIRNTIDFWSRENYSATGQASLFVICIGTSIAIMFANTSVKDKVFAGIMGGIIFVYNLVLACRTPIILAIIVIFAAVCNLAAQTERRSTKRRIMLSIAIALLIVLAIFELNLFGIRERLLTSNLFLRVIDAQLSDSRLDIRSNYIREIWFYPFGGSNLMQKYGYAHDFFFDTWDKAGIVAAVMILYYVLQSGLKMMRILKSTWCSFFIKQLILCVFLAYYIEFLVEPIIYGMPWLFSTFCMIDGVVSAIESKYRHGEPVKDLVE